MKNIHAPNASLPSYLSTALVINFKEWLLRIRKNFSRFIFIILLGVLLVLIVEWIGYIYFLLLFIVVVFDFVRELFYYWRMAINRQKQYPEGILIEVDDEGFKKTTIQGFQWEKISWDSIAFVFDNKLVKSIALYQRNTKEYHLFFVQYLNCDDYKELRKIIFEKINKIY